MSLRRECRRQLDLGADTHSRRTKDQTTSVAFYQVIMMIIIIIIILIITCCLLLLLHENFFILFAVQCSTVACKFCLVLCSCDFMFCCYFLWSQLVNSDTYSIESTLFLNPLNLYSPVSCQPVPAPLGFVVYFCHVCTGHFWCCLVYISTCMTAAGQFTGLSDVCDLTL